MKYLKLILLGILTNLTVNNTNASTNTNLLDSEQLKSLPIQTEQVDKFADTNQSTIITLEQVEKRNEQQFVNNYALYNMNKELSTLNINDIHVTEENKKGIKGTIIPVLQFYNENEDELFNEKLQLQSEDSSGSRSTSGKNSGRKDANKQHKNDEVNISKLNNSLQNEYQKNKSNINVKKLSQNNTNIKIQYQNNKNGIEQFQYNILQDSVNDINFQNIIVQEQYKYCEIQKELNQANPKNIILKEPFENKNITQVNKNNSENIPVNQQTSTNENQNILLHDSSNNTNVKKQFRQNDKKDTIEQNNLINKTVNKEKTLVNKKHEKHEKQTRLGALGLEKYVFTNQNVYKKRSKSMNKLNNNIKQVNINEQARTMKIQAFKNLFENFKQQPNNDIYPKLSPITQNALLWFTKEIFKLSNNNDKSEIFTRAFLKQYAQEINKLNTIAIADINNCINLLKEACINRPKYKIAYKDLPTVLHEFNNILDPKIDKFISYVQKNTLCSHEVLNDLKVVNKNINNIKKELPQIIAQMPSIQELPKVSEKLLEARKYDYMNEIKNYIENISKKLKSSAVFTYNKKTGLPYNLRMSSKLMLGLTHVLEILPEIVVLAHYYGYDQNDYKKIYEEFNNNKYNYINTIATYLNNISKDSNTITNHKTILSTTECIPEIVKVLKLEDFVNSFIDDIESIHKILTEYEHLSKNIN